MSLFLITVLIFLSWVLIGLLTSFVARILMQAWDELFVLDAAYFWSAVGGWFAPLIFTVAFLVDRYAHLPELEDHTKEGWEDEVR